VRSLLRALAEQDAIVGDDADRITPNPGEAGDQGRAIQVLELIELGPVHDARDQRPHVVRLPHIGRHDAVQVAGGEQRLPRRLDVERGPFHAVQVADDGACDAERVGVVLGQVVGDAADPAVQLAAAQVLRRHDLPGCGAHQGRASEENGALVAHDDALVRHCRHVSAAGGAASHHDGDLRDAFGGHASLVEEDAAEVVAVGEYLVLARQVGAAAVHQIDAGQSVLLRDLLRPQVLFHRHREVGAALHRGVVRYHDALAPGDAADAGDNASGRDVAAIQAVCRELRQFQKWAAGVDQRAHAVPRQQFATPGVTLARRLPAAQPDLIHNAPQILDQGGHTVLVGAERRQSRVHAAVKHRHRDASCDSVGVRGGAAGRIIPPF